MVSNFNPFDTAVSMAVAHALAALAQCSWQPEFAAPRLCELGEWVRTVASLANW